VIPDRTARLLGAHFQTQPATDTFLLIYHANIAVGGIRVGRANGTCPNAYRLYAMPAGSNNQIVGELAKGILNDLYARER
jgi:hypothetical protein